MQYREKRIDFLTECSRKDPGKFRSDTRGKEEEKEEAGK